MKLGMGRKSYIFNMEQGRDITEYEHQTNHRAEDQGDK